MITTDSAGREAEIAAFFGATFTASEGPQEGAVLERLVLRLMAETPKADLRFFEEGALAGAIFFSRMVYGGDPRDVFLLSPVAVATARQGQGVGQRLLRHGLKALGADVVLTYGDPAYYSRVGFRPIGVETAPAPFPLQFPEGWQAHAAGEIAPLQGLPRCAPAFDDPGLW